MECGCFCSTLKYKSHSAYWCAKIIWLRKIEVKSNLSGVAKIVSKNGGDIVDGNFAFFISNRNQFPGDHDLRKREEIQQRGRWAAGRRSERHTRKCGKGQQFSRMRTKRRSFNYKFFFMVTFCRIKRKYILHRTWEWKGNPSKSYKCIKQLLNSLFLGSIRLCFLKCSWWCQCMKIISID